MCALFTSLFKKLNLFIDFRERGREGEREGGREGEREREKH